MPIASSILAEFRNRIKDVRFSSRAFGLAITDQAVTNAIAEVTAGHLIVTIAGGSGTPTLDFDLTSSRYDTIGKLYQVLSRTPGYRASLDEDANVGHPSIDLEQFGPLSVQGVGVDLQHHLFSDSELEEILKYALQRHNPTLTLATLPPQEWAFVMPLAQANTCRIQAYDATKRRGLAQESGTLIQLADSFEKQYTDDTTRLARAIRSPKETNSNINDEGDVMLGQQFRRSLRTGFMSPLSQVIPPDFVVLNDPDMHDVEDDNVRIVWQRNKNVDFYSYELWMDSRPEVERTREGGLVFAGTPVSFQSLQDSQNNSAHRLTTSRLIFRSFGANSNSSRSSFSTFVEEFGQLIRSFSVGALEPLMTYYFRLYVIDLNYEASGSNIVKATTKTLRTRFLSQSVNNLQPQRPVGPYTDKTAGPPGTVVNYFLDTTRAPFTPACTFLFGGKEVVPTILAGGFQAQIVVPTFQTYGVKDVSIISPNSLIDVRNQAFTLSSS